MAEEKTTEVQNESKWNGVNFTTPKQVSGRDAMRTFKRADGREMAEITLPPHTEITAGIDEKQDASFYKFIVPKTSVKEFENDASNLSIAMPSTSKDGKPWMVDLVQEKGHWEHPEAEGKDRGEFMVTFRNKISISSEQFAADMQEARRQRSEWAKENRDQEKASAEETKKSKAKGFSIREAGEQAKKASEKLAQEAKSAPQKDKDSISIDNGVSLG